MLKEVNLSKIEEFRGKRKKYDLFADGDFRVLSKYDEKLAKQVLSEGRAELSAVYDTMNEVEQRYADGVFDVGVREWDGHTSKIYKRKLNIITIKNILEYSDDIIIYNDVYCNNFEDFCNLPVNDGVVFNSN